MRDAVLAPDGRTWRVRRQWVPRLGQETLWGRFRRRFGRTFRRTADLADFDPGCGEAIVEGLVVLVVVLVAIFVGIPFLIALLDVRLLLLLAVLALLARLLLRRPWIVEASADDGRSITWRVRGWAESGRRCAEIEERLRAGLDLPPLG